MASAGIALAQNRPDPLEPEPVRKGRIKQSAMRNNFDPKMPFVDVCRHTARLGCKGMDFISPDNWPTLRRFGLVPTMANRGFGTVEDGLLRPELHPKEEAAMRLLIDQCAANGCPTIVMAGGQRRGISYEEGADIIVAFFNRLKSQAEEKGVTLCIEIMSKKTRPDQIFDHIPWGVDVCKRVNSPSVKILFDIYHAQTMDGDICNHIRDNIQWIGHFHTAGVPGRHEIDDTQELNYRFIAQTIAGLGYTGYVAHEYRPAPGRDPLKSLDQAITIMDV
jgi:hydroxypyruvate isomerase